MQANRCHLDAFLGGLFHWIVMHGRIAIDPSAGATVDQEVGNAQALGIAPE